MTYQELQEKLIDLDDEYEYSVSVGTIRTPDEIANEVYSVIKKLGWTEDEAQDYIDFVKHRYD
jgi:cell division septum initiation protein DivIVA